MPNKATADYSESKFMKQREETRVERRSWYVNVPQ
jgi:hypothetical protein